jgi:hypothetical protein
MNMRFVASMLTTSALLPLASGSSQIDAWPRLRHIRKTPRWMRQAPSLCLPSGIISFSMKFLAKAF